MNSRNILARMRKEDYIGHFMFFILVAFVLVCAVIPSILQYWNREQRNSEFLPHKWFGQFELDNTDDTVLPEQTRFLVYSTNINMLVGKWELRPVKYPISQLAMTISNPDDINMAVDIDIGFFFINSKRWKKGIGSEWHVGVIQDAGGPETCYICN